MTRSIALAGVALLLLSAPVLAASSSSAHTKAAHTAKAAAKVVYQCSKCHMRFSAAQAKKDHYVDPMDGGKLVPVK